MKSRILGRVLTRLFALFGMTLTCVACYGTPYEEYRYDFGASGRVVDSKGEPINGIKVSTHGESMTTSSNGRFYVEGIDRGIATVSFDDVDGEANGGEFVSRHIDIGGEAYSDLGDVVLLRADKEEDKSEE